MWVYQILDIISTATEAIDEVNELSVEMKKTIPEEK